MQQNAVVVGHFYTHISSRDTYIVVEIANETSDKWPIMVVYVDTNRHTWARPMKEFLVKFERYVEPDKASEIAKPAVMHHSV